MGQNQARTFLPLVCESRIYKFLDKTSTAYVHDFCVQFLRFQKHYHTNYPTIPPKLLNTFWIITDLLQTTAANFLRSLQFRQLNLLLRLGVGCRSLSIFSLLLSKLSIRHFLTLLIPRPIMVVKLK